MGEVERDKERYDQRRNLEEQVMPTPMYMTHS
jgi:hypothetical protein